MYNLKNIAIGTLLAIVVIDEAVIIPFNNRRATKALKKQSDLIDFLGSMLDKHDVPLTEFDKIAMMSLTD